MPQFRLETNLPRDQIPKEFSTELLQALAETFGKPEELCAVTIVPDQIMGHGTNEEPYGQATLMSIGKIGEEENFTHSKVISDKIAQLGISPTNLLITFNDMRSLLMLELEDSVL